MGIPVVDFPLPAWVGVAFGAFVAIMLTIALIKIWRRRDGASLIGMTGLLLLFTSMHLWLYGGAQGRLDFIAAIGGVVGAFAMAFYVRLAAYASERA